MNAHRFWESFAFDYRADLESTSAELISVEAYKLAALNLLLPPEWRAQLDKLNRVRAVHGTTALEGNPLSEADVSHQIDLLDQEAATDRPLTKEQLQIRNGASAQAWVQERFAPNSPPVSIADILAIHRMATERSDETHNVPGRLRSFSVQVGAPDMGGIHVGAPHERLPTFMQDFVSFVNSRRMTEQHPVVRALLAHFFLVTIHPFGDGNGRVSRLVEAGILFQRDYNVHGFYGLSNFFYRHEREYKTLLQECRTHRPFDVTPFISFGIKGFVEELAGINNFIKTKMNRVVYRQMLVANYNRRVGGRRRLLNAREYELLLYLLDETEPADPFSERPSRQVAFAELHASPYVRGAYRGVTERTFIRELQRLAELGFIKLARDQGAARPLFIELDFEAIAKNPVY